MTITIQIFDRFIRNTERLHRICDTIEKDSGLNKMTTTDAPDHSADNLAMVDHIVNANKKVMK